jgi:hypothetical protein
MHYALENWAWNADDSAARPGNNQDSRLSLEQAGNGAER